MSDRRASAWDLGGKAQKAARAQIYQTLAQPLPYAFDQTTLRENIRTPPRTLRPVGGVSSDLGHRRGQPDQRPLRDGRRHQRRYAHH